MTIRGAQKDSVLKLEQSFKSNTQNMFCPCLKKHTKAYKKIEN